MRGYWDDDERTREAIDAAGWMHSGDLATIDAEGYCNIVGRVKDMLIRGGENVYPARDRGVPACATRRSQTVQVFGVPDRAATAKRSAPGSCSSPAQAATDDEIRDFCRGQIAHYKVPRYIRFVAEFPLTATGKPQKFVMREAMMAELGLKEQRTA